MPVAEPLTFTAQPAVSAEAAANHRHVFVYGTLRRGSDNDITRFRPAPRFVGHARITGRMYHLGAYPGVVLEGGGGIVGEVYAIDAVLERQLDELEEVYPQAQGGMRDEYIKREIAVGVGGQQMLCIVYEINTAFIVNRPLIQSGDWVKDRHLAGVAKS